VPLAGGGTVVADEAYLTESMMDPLARLHAGFQPVMPTYLGILDPGQTAAIVQLIKSLRDVSPPTGEHAGPKAPEPTVTEEQRQKRMQGDPEGAPPPGATPAGTPLGTPAGNIGQPPPGTAALPPLGVLTPAAVEEALRQGSPGAFQMPPAPSVPRTPAAPGRSLPARGDQTP
jgi:hypothetical protein